MWAEAATRITIAWNGRTNIRKLFIDVYRELFDEEAIGIPDHIGLECGIIAKNMGRKVDMISIGPEIRRFKP